MNKVMRWTGYGLAGLVGVVVIAGLIIWALSARALAHRVDPKPERLVMIGASVANGQHLLQTRGCGSCHGDNLQGRKFIDEAGLATLYAPNLTRLAAYASDQQLAQAIRQGIGHDGRALFVMPSTTYAALTDEETADLVAAMRAAPRGGSDTPSIMLGPLGSLGVALGKFETQPSMMAAHLAKPAADLGPATASGRHVAMTSCADCHGSDLTGKEVEPGLNAPDLAMVGSYDKAQFASLMKTGLPPGGRDLGLMTEVGRKSFSHFNDREVADLFDYLQARARR